MVLYTVYSLHQARKCELNIKKSTKYQNIRLTVHLWEREISLFAYKYIIKDIKDGCMLIIFLVNVKVCEITTVA